MEESISGAGDYLEQVFALEEKDWSQYSPLTLAYIGDAVYDMIVRTVLVRRANTQTEKLHRQASALVKAEAQARVAAALQPCLSAQEQSVYRRGHNAKPYSTAKNASRRDYLEATGLEALIGYLYLKREYRRIIDLISRGMEECGYRL